MLEKGAIEKVRLPGPGFNAHLFLHPKKDGSMRPILNLKPLNRFVRYQHFKMENLAAATTIIQQNDCFTKVDLKDADFAVSVHPSHRKYLRFVWDKEVYQFVSLPFGLASAPRVFTKLLKPGVSLLRHLGMRLVQYLDDGLFMSHDPLGQARDAVCDDKARFHCELGEIRAKPQAGDRISGYDKRLPPNASFPTTSQSAEYQGQVPAAVDIEVHNCTSGGETGREDCCVSEGGSARTTILQAATDAENAGLAGTTTELRGGNNPHPRVQGRAAMVGQMSGSARWPVFPDISAGHDYPDRCFEAGVGGGDGPGTHTRGLVSDGVEASHQYSRVEGRQLCSQGLHQRDQGETCSLVDGQQHGRGLRQQPRGHKINEVDSGSQRALKLLSCEQDHSCCRAPGGQTECRSRSGVQAIQGRQQLEARRDHFPGPGAHMWPMEMDLFADRLNKQLPAYASWKPDPMAQVKLIIVANFIRNWWRHVELMTSQPHMAEW